MVYALNVFNLLPERENEYRDYSVKAGKIIYGMGGRVVASGWKPIRKLHGDTERRYLIVVEFPSEVCFRLLSTKQTSKISITYARMPAPITSGRSTNRGIFASG